SSRRRHTRFSRDWSSDLCSSDLGEHRVVVFSETLPLGVVIMEIELPLPTFMAFDPKVIVGLQGELPLAGPAFQDSLGQSNAGRDPKVPHLVLGNRSEEHTSELQSHEHLVC